MTKFPYVTDYKMETVDVKVAEELLAEYNDFFLYNQSQYHDIFKRAMPVIGDDGEETEMETDIKRCEANAKAATDEFEKMFDSKDFAKSSLVGLKIDWDALQQILLLEQKKRTPVCESAVAHTAYQLRNLASLLLFAEAIIKKSPEAQPQFESALERVLANELTLPEFHKEKSKVTKLKKPEQIAEYVSNLLEAK